MQVVTGGAGFIGSHICQILLKRGDSVRILDNFSSGKIANIESFRTEYPGQFQVFEGDIRDAVTVAQVMEGATTVFHQAAMVSVQESVENPLEANSVNLEGTLKVFQAAKEAGVSKLVFASSTAVYGSSEELPKRETMAAQPLSPYAAAKYGSEIYGRIFSTIYGLPVVSLRYFNVYGPRQDPASEYAAVIPKFISRMLAGKRPVIFGDGEQTRDFVFVNDVARANLLAAEADASGLALNIAAGQRYSLNDLVVILDEILGLNFQPVYEPARLGEVRDSQADILLANKTIGYAPEVTVHDGLRRTVEWFKANG
ncbi:MAG: SDR family oxidoreductase [Acidobacteria bacterium]|nr:MAG: SDR family oxidoreductase [Acidobacteriota bacterium]